MLRNYFKTAWRSLRKNKGFTITNLLGLTIGMTCSSLIFLWVHDELSYDRFHLNYDHIDQVLVNRGFNNGNYTDHSIVFPLAHALEKGYPAIRYAVVTTHNQDHILAYKDIRIKKGGYTVSEHFFDIFSWVFVEGNAATALTDPRSVVLTQSAAKAFFGNEDPMNKVLTIDNHDNLKVSAVVKDPPGNSSLSFDFVKLFDYSDPGLKMAMNEWNSASSQVYLQLAPGADSARVTKAIGDIMRLHDPANGGLGYFLFPMSRWRLYADFTNGKNTGGLIDYVRLFSAIALIILLIACINFMNLSTARSGKRAKEVGIRKTLGSGTSQLRWQFLLESMMLAGISFVFSLVLTILMLPYFNGLVGKTLRLEPGDSVFWIGSAAIVVFTGLVAGSYPAFYLSSFNPIGVLKGRFLAGKNAIIPRRTLVVFQFVISILLISATLIVYQQLRYVKNRDLGYKQDNLLMITMSSEANKNYTALKQDLLNTGLIYAATRTESPITEIDWKSGAPDWTGKPPGQNLIVSGQATDIDFTKTVGVRIWQGHDFTGMPSDTSAMLMNKAALAAMHMDRPLGRLLTFGSQTYTVIGITDDMVMEDPYKPVEPLMTFYDPAQAQVVTCRLNKDVSPQAALPVLKTLFRKYDPQTPFDCQFVDKEFGKKFVAAELIGRITDIFAALAIFICCLGLAGLASFTIERRFREIGIRKVFGASVTQIFGLISREFIQLVLLAFVIAVPITWWAMNNWLAGYALHIDINPLLFVGVGLMIGLLTLLVVGLNSLRAALSNPVKSLRTE
jgi:putative ABC transport system permease protein